MTQQRFPHNQQMLNQWLSFFQSGRFDKAEKLARSVLAAEPRNAELLQFVALLCQAQVKYADAEAPCATAVSLAPIQPRRTTTSARLMNRGRSEHQLIIDRKRVGAGIIP